uniref:Uncharacterized protein n=1 Tax=Octopus bimaculoides TaxID=37653 RepID=A0A0L8IBF7_OCTBM
MRAVSQSVSINVNESLYAVRDAVAEKKRALEEWLQKGDEEAYDIYREVKKRVKGVVRLVKLEEKKRFGKKLSEHFMFWKEVQRVRKVVGGREEKVKDVNGNLLKGSEDVKRKWAEYFRELLNVEDIRKASIVSVGEEKRMPVV